MRWTDELRAICADRCAYPYGEPPCWRLPELVDDCGHIEPCAECLADAAPMTPVIQRGIHE